MEDDFKEKVKELLKNEENTNDYILGFNSYNTGFDNMWILLLVLVLLLDKPIEEKKEPQVAINLYFGADE